MNGAAQRRLNRGRAGAAAAVALLASAPSVAAQTRPGTAILNTASFRDDAGSGVSNQAVLTVAERLDVALARAEAADTVSAQGERRIAVTLVNRGSGEEAFVVDARVASGRATLGAPAGLVEGRTPVLAPGASLTLFFPAADIAEATVVEVAAQAATGSGAAGTAFPRRGDGGGDAVVGATGAAARLRVSLAIAAAALPTLEKTQAVLAPDGSASAVRGAVVTYTLVARFAAPVRDAALADPIPAGTAYVAGSLSLDDTPLADAGHLAAGALTVPLGPVAAGSVRTLRFKVVIS